MNQNPLKQPRECVFLRIKSKAAASYDSNVFRIEQNIARNT